MITVIGDAMIKLVSAPGSSLLTASPDGSAFSAAIQAARLGYPTALMARLSRDPLGQILRLHAAKHGLDLSASPEADEPTMITVASTYAGTDSTDSLYFRDAANWQWSTAELGCIPADTTVLHLDSLACCVPPGSTPILRAAARQRSRGAVVCVNVCVKPAVLGSPGRGRLLIDRPIGAADVVTTSIEDISWLYPGRGAEAVARLWLTRGPELVVMTCGCDGLVAVRKTGGVLHRPTRLRTVSENEFGAAFTGALLGELHQLSHSGASIGALNTGELAQMLDRATGAASQSDSVRFSLATASESS